MDKVSFYSKVLGKEMSMLIYLQESYNSLDSLPVLYFLHGRSGIENIMLEMNINIEADVMIKAGEIEPMIIVCPIVVE